MSHFIGNRDIFLLFCAERRLLDFKERGIKSDQTVDEIEKGIAARDYKDSHRKISPLKKAGRY